MECRPVEWKNLHLFCEKVNGFRNILELLVYYQKKNIVR